MSLISFERMAAAFAATTMRRLQRLAAAAALGLAAVGVADKAAALELFTGQFGTGNTWNVYEAIDTPSTFKEALAFAATRPDPTGGTTVGHLVTLSSLAENNFVHSTPGIADRWIGLTDRVGAAPGATESALTADQLTMGWAWVTGEPFTFENWTRDEFGTPIEPNNAGPGEDAAHLRNDAASNWNDHKSGFGENDPPLTPPDPESTDETEGGAAPIFGYIIEWSKNLATQPPGFPATRPDPVLPRVYPSPLARIPGPNGTASAWGVMDVRDLGGPAHIKHAVAMLLSGEGTRVEGTAARFDIHDPEEGGNQGAIPGPQIPMVSDTAGVADDNFVSVVKGTVSVPAGQGGDYTFNVHSDDGFALRILSQATGGPLTQHRFTSQRGGFVDEDGTLVFAFATGDSNTQGIVNLAPGAYDIEFTTWDGCCGTFWEVSTAKGDFVNNAATSVQWLLLGDGSSLPQFGPFTQAARLTAPATVKNFDAQPDVASVVANIRTNPAPTAQGAVAEVVLKDNEPICCGRPGGGLPAAQQHLFPNGGGDNFSTGVTGAFTVLDTNGAAGETLTFGLFADDNSALHIVGQSFTAVADFTGDGDAALFNPEGGTDQWLVADFGTGNSNSFGLITLPEGTYDFEAFERQGTGDAGLEVWVAAGDRLAAGLGSGAFFPLTTATLPTQFLAANQGLALVAGPGVGPAPQPGDFDGDNDVDGNDFLVWQRGLGTTHSAATLATWKANFGMTGAEAAAGAVPEPTAAWLAVLAGFCFGRRLTALPT